MINRFQRLDLSDHTGRIFVVGDIHGAYTKLEAALAELNFDWDEDILLSVGDLIDRGPENERCIEFLNKPNFYAIQGNHEEFAYTLRGRGIHGVAQNGGKWLAKLKYKNPELQGKIVNRLFGLPILMEVILPSGKKIGLAHACYPHDDWEVAERLANNTHAVQSILWDREPLRALQRGHGIKEIKNVDHIYYGHTPLRDRFDVGNQSWIDTGAVFDDGHYTVVELD